MSTPIRIKRSSTEGKRPTTNQLQLGELAVNFYDGHLYSKRDTSGVGIGTTVALLTPWKEEFGGGTIEYVGIVTATTYRGRGGDLTLGTPNDGNLTDNGALNTFTSNSSLVNSIDDLNEVSFNIIRNTAVTEVGFTANTTAGAATLNVTLTITSSGNANRYDIDWGDGSSTDNTTDSTPSHAYTDVAGGFSTSTRLGYRWLNGDRSWMYGLNAGYDSCSLKSGITDTGVSVTNKKTVGFQQIALNAEAVSNGWTFNGYGLIPVGDVEQKLNSVYQGGALNTYGLDVGYFISPALHASVGYYYQHRDQEDVDGSGVRGRLAYDITQGLTAGVNISYDEAYDTRVSADLSVRFGGPSTTAAKKKKWENPTINALTASPKNRDVRIHDKYCLTTRDGMHYHVGNCPNTR